MTEEVIPDDTPEFIEEPLPEPIEPTIEVKQEIKEPVFQPVEQSKKEPVPILPEEDDDKYGEIVFFAEEMPRFPGCEEEISKDAKRACSTKQLLSYIYKHIKYPAIARHNQIEGTVVVGFIVERNGQLSNIEILREIGGGCGKEAARVIKSMPLWTPGKTEWPSRQGTVSPSCQIQASISHIHTSLVINSYQLGSFFDDQKRVGFSIRNDPFHFLRPSCCKLIQKLYFWNLITQIAL